METPRIWITASDDTWVVRAGGAVIGETTRALEVQHEDGPTEIYFPREDIGMAFLERSETVSAHPLKGQATHFHIAAKSGRIADAGWSFEAPMPEALRLAGFIAFNPARVTVEMV